MFVLGRNVAFHRSSGSADRRRVQVPPAPVASPAPEKKPLDLRPQIRILMRTFDECESGRISAPGHFICGAGQTTVRHFCWDFGRLMVSGLECPKLPDCR